MTRDRLMSILFWTVAIAVTLVAVWLLVPWLSDYDPVTR
jgi:hypothetical protein